MRKMIVAGLVMIVAIACAMGCEKAPMTGEEQEAVVSEMADDTAATAPAPEKSVGAATVVSGDNSWTVEVVSTEEDREHGLGGRESLPAKNGMWFVFPANSQDPFWMKDMKFNLDIVFVGDDMKVVDVKSGTIDKPTELIYSQAPYRYVLEVNAGEGQALNVGDAVDYRMGPK